MTGDTRVVSIDGAAGSGKSTLARSLARALELPYVNTGSMYRALAAAAVRGGIDPDDAAGLVELARGLRFTVQPGDPPELEVEGYGPEALTNPHVESIVSAVARHPSVRALMHERQRDLAAHGAVMEGRDIGSVVVPEAAVKLFLVAAPEERATRRVKERSADPASIATSLHRRDAADASTTPPTPPERSDVLDTGTLDAAATLEAAIAIVAQRAPWLLRDGEDPEP
jgi:cytidylate kinase